MATIDTPTKPVQIRVTRRSPAYWRVTIDNPPINVMGPEMVKQFQDVMNALEGDEQVRVVVFDSAVDDYFLNHSDFMAKLEDLTSLPPGRPSLTGRRLSRRECSVLPTPANGSRRPVSQAVVHPVASR